MKISLTHYNTEHAVNTDPTVNYLDINDLDETTCFDALKAFKSVLLSAGYQNKSIQDAFKLMESEW